MEKRTKIFIAISAGVAAAITIIVGHKKGWFKKKSAITTTTNTTTNNDTSKDISKEKASEIYKLWFNKKSEMATAKYTAEGLVMARAVLAALEKSIEDGGWKIDPNPAMGAIPLIKKQNGSSNKQYVANQDFVAKQFVAQQRPEQSKVLLPTKSFKKGSIIDVTEQVDFGMNKHLVTLDGFGIPKNMVSAYKE